MTIMYRVVLTGRLRLQLHGIRYLSTSSAEEHKVLLDRAAQTLNVWKDITTALGWHADFSEVSLTFSRPKHLSTQSSIGMGVINYFNLHLNPNFNTLTAEDGEGSKFIYLRVSTSMGGMTLAVTFCISQISLLSGPPIHSIGLNINLLAMCSFIKTALLAIMVLPHYDLEAELDSVLGTFTWRLQISTSHTHFCILAYEVRF